MANEEQMEKSLFFLKKAFNSLTTFNFLRRKVLHFSSLSLSTSTLIRFSFLMTTVPTRDSCGWSGCGFRCLCCFLAEEVLDLACSTRKQKGVRQGCVFTYLGGRSSAALWSGSPRRLVLSRPSGLQRPLLAELWSRTLIQPSHKNSSGSLRRQERRC